MGKALANCQLSIVCLRCDLSSFDKTCPQMYSGTIQSMGAARHADFVEKNKANEVS